MAKGFAPEQPQKKQPSKAARKRAEAAQTYDRMTREGTPDFEIYVRIPGKEQWFPVGVIAVKRVDLVNYAIRDNQAQLQEAAGRLFPPLRKQEVLEFGYRLKELKGEPIKAYEEPKLKIPNPLTAIGERIAQIFNPRKY